MSKTRTTATPARYCLGMKTIVAPLALTLLALAGCGDSGPSLDQQQQAWEGEMREQACDTYKLQGGESVARSQAMSDLADGSGDQVDAMKRALGVDSMSAVPDSCTGSVFERHATEEAVRNFPESPKGQAGETTAPPPR